VFGWGVSVCGGCGVCVCVCLCEGVCVWCVCVCVCGTVRPIFETATTQPFSKICQNSTTLLPLSDVPPSWTVTSATVCVRTHRRFSKSCPSVRPSARPPARTALTGRIFVKFDVLSIFENLFREYWIVIKCDKNNRYITLPEDQYTFFITSRQFRLRMRNVTDKSVIENQNTHFVFHIPPHRKSCRLWDNVGEVWSNKTGHRWRYGASALRAW